MWSFSSPSSWLWLWMIACCAATPLTNDIFPLRPALLANTSTSTPNTTHPLLAGSKTPVIFSVPDTTTTLHLSNYHHLLNQNELDLLIIEGLSTLLTSVANSPKTLSSTLPLHTWSATWAHALSISVSDVSPPAFAMRYGDVVAMLRGVAFFASLYGSVEMDVEVWVEGRGRVGSGVLEKIEKGEGGDAEY